MRFEVSPYVLAQAVSALISIATCMTAWRRRTRSGGLAFALMMTAISVWTSAVTVEEGVVGLAAKMFFTRLSYLGVVNVAPLFLLFAWSFGRSPRRFPAAAAALWVIPVITLVLVVTNDLHHLVWSSITPSNSPDNLAVYGHGPAWWVFCGYCLVLVLVGSAHLGTIVLTTSRAFAVQSGVVLAAVCVVAAGFVVYVAPGNPVPGLDLPAASFAVAGALILLGLARTRAASLSPIARETLVEAMPDGLLVVDPRGTVVDANPAALELLRQRRSVIGSPLSAAVERWPELAAALPTGTGREVSALVKREQRFFEAALSPLGGPTGEHLGRMITIRDVTARREAQLASQENEESLRLLLSAARRQAKELELLDQVRTSLAAELDLDAIFKTVVEGIARVFGYTQVSLFLLRDGVLVIQHQVGYHRVVERIPLGSGVTGRVARTGVPVLLEDVRQDPEFIGAIEGVTSEVCVPLFDRGKPVGVLNVESIGGVAMGPQDLRLMVVLGEHVSIAFTKARLYAEARDNEERYRALVATLGEGVAITDLDERFVFANPAAEAVFGASQDGLVGRTLGEFLAPEEMQHALEETGRRREGRSSTYELVIRRPDGQSRTIELIATPRFSPDGSVSGTLGVFRDVTELRRLQRSLEQERALLLTLIDSLPDYVYLKDQEGRFVLVNRAQALLSGAKDARELVGKTDADVVSPEIADGFRAGDEQVMRTRTPMVNVEENCQAADGTLRRVLTTKVPLFDHTGEVTGVVGISRDVTDIARAEEERARLQEQLQQSQKMEAVGRLAGGIAHDFNNILTVITGYCEMAIEEAGDNAALQGSLEEIKRASRRSATLISQLLTFSRRQLSLPRVFDLGDLVAEMEGMLHRLLGEDIRLETVREGDTLRVNADPGQVEQVIMNLAVNSRDAMPHGGHLLIRTRAVRLGPEDLGGQPEVVPGDFVGLQVSDTGLGMDAATQERIFEPFFTTKEVGKGTGLGLATVYGIVRQNQGRVTWESEVGHGTTFTVYLPRVGASPDGAAAPEAGLSRPVGGTERILLAEDDESVRGFVGSILENAGYTVLTADSGAAALDQLGRLPHPPDLLLSDVIMPGMDGRALAEEVARRAPGVRVVLMSGYAEVAAGLPGLREPDPRLIQKPFSVADLLMKIRSALDKRPGQAAQAKSDESS